jgi:NADPH:quinone reductase-like Zn-dependent oxidoreductase
MVADWGKEVRALTQNRGVNHVIETGSADTLARSIGCTAEEGVVTFIAALEAATIDIRTLASPVVIRRIYVGSRAHFEVMNQAIAAHLVRPIIDRVFSFSETHEAYRYFGGRGHFGKVVIAGD